MTNAEKEAIWSALHLGKVEALRAYQLTQHIEGAREIYDICDRDICAAMDLLNREVEAE